MTILLDILHPAHVHFFRNAISDLQRQGNRVLVTARDKDLTLQLLELYDIPFTCISREARTRLGLARELVTRNVKMVALVTEERPRVLASIGGISTAQAGVLTRTRNLIFYDTENATISNLLSYPFASRVVTPDCYRARVYGRQATYPGYHELAYLHPRRFEPDHGLLKELGVDTDTPYSVLRFVSWKAVHDVGVEGFTREARRRLVDTLTDHGDVFITSESPLPGDLDQFRLPVPPHRIHHLLAFAQLFVGESATMASESAILGTPAIFVDPVGRGYTDEQESRYGLCFNFRPWEVDEAIARAESILKAGMKRSAELESARARLLAEKTDVTDIICQWLLREG